MCRPGALVPGRAVPSTGGPEGLRLRGGGAATRPRGNLPRKLAPVKTADFAGAAAPHRDGLPSQEDGLRVIEPLDCPSSCTVMAPGCRSLRF